MLQCCRVMICVAVCCILRHCVAMCYNLLQRVAAVKYQDMGWLRLVGSLKLWGSLTKEPHKRDYILPKRHTILRSLLIVATPYPLYCKREYTILVARLFCKRDICAPNFYTKETYIHRIFTQTIRKRTHDFLRRTGGQLCCSVLRCGAVYCNV